MAEGRGERVGDSNDHPEDALVHSRELQDREPSNEDFKESTRCRAREPG